MISREIRCKCGRDYNTVYNSFNELVFQYCSYCNPINKPPKLDSEVQEGIIKHDILNLMKSWALEGMYNKLKRYRGINKRITNKESKTAYAFLITGLLEKLDKVNKFDLKYHKYCLESASETTNLKQALQDKDSEIAIERKRVLDIFADKHKLQSKLNAIEEVIEKYCGVQYDLWVKIKQIIGDEIK